MGDLELPDALVVRVYLLVQTQLLLLKNHLLGLKLVDFFTNTAERRLKVDEVALVGDPVSLGFDVINLNLFNFAFDAIALRLIRSLVFINVSVLSQLSISLVLLVDLLLLLRNVRVFLLDVVLKLFLLLLFSLKLLHQLVQLLLQLAVLVVRVHVVYLNS